MLFGIGSVSVGSNNLDASSLLGQNLSFPQCVAGVEFSIENNAVMAQCYRSGQLVKVAHRINSEDAMVTLTYQNISWPEMQLLYGEVARSGGAVIPTAKTVVVTGTSITEPDISTANNNAASLRLFNETEEVFMTLAVSTPGPNEYSVAPATGVITLNAAQTGDTISYKYDKIYTSIESIGAGTTSQQFDALNDLNLIAILSSSLYPQGIVLSAPKLSRIASPTLSIAGDRAEVSIQYALLTPPGFRRSFQLYKLDGSVAS